MLERVGAIRLFYILCTCSDYEITEYLELFLRNLLLDEKNELRNRFMYISGLFDKKWTLRIKKRILKVQKWTFGRNNCGFSQRVLLYT